MVTDSRSAKELGIRRSKYPGVRFFLRGHPNEVLIGARAICVSGGVPLDLPILELARKRRIPFTNDAQLFIERCPAPVIGITGSGGQDNDYSARSENTRGSRLQGLARGKYWEPAHRRPSENQKETTWLLWSFLAFSSN